MVRFSSCREGGLLRFTHTLVVFMFLERLRNHFKDWALLCNRRNEEALRFRDLKRCCLATLHYLRFCTVDVHYWRATIFCLERTVDER